MFYLSYVTSELRAGWAARCSPRSASGSASENAAARLNLTGAGRAGERFTRTSFLSTQQLSFPASEVSKIASRSGVQASAGSLTLSAITISGRVPEGGLQAGGGAGGPGAGGGGCASAPSPPPVLKQVLNPG